MVNSENVGFKDFSLEKLRGIALWWNRQGIPVVPIYINHESGEKIILVEGWKHWQTQPQSLEEFEKLGWDRANAFACVCGVKTRLGFFGALDFDVKNQTSEAIKLGEEVFNQLPETRVDKTPSSGKHSYYFSLAQIRPRKDLMASVGLEVLGIGNMVIMFPSQGYEIIHYPKHGYAVVQDLNALIDLILFKLGCFDIPEKEGD
jgi:hypothetical protein